MARVIPDEIQSAIDTGDYSRAREMLAKQAAKPDVSPFDQRDLLFEAERLRRIPIDFCLDTSEVLAQLKEDIPGAGMDDVEAWTADGSLESRMIDGKRKYFRRAVRNLYILNKTAAERRKPGSVEKEKKTHDKHGQIVDLRVHAQRALDARKVSPSPLVTPRRFRADYTVTVKPGQAPEGEMIRCWLPFPRNVRTQTDIRLLETRPERHILAPESMLQRSVYLEQPSNGDRPTSFFLSFEYTAWAFVEPIDPAKVQPYDMESELYRKYTAERPSQIEFLPEIRQLAEEIIGEENNPYLKAKKLYAWVEQNIVWSGAIEYSTVPNLGLRALKRRTGDCGMQGLLLITLCRASGIPARWQSGWSLRPAGVNLHDWMEFYVEPWGWLYADPSRGFFDSRDEAVKWFNFGNFDRFRLIVNSDYGMELYPPKKHFRSEPVDFQRGEIEWKGGNLYFNQWGYDMEITPLEGGDYPAK